MQTFSSLLFSIALVFSASASLAEPFQYPKSEVRIIESPDGQEQPYKIFIFEPDTTAPKEGFPVLYILDGNGVFGSTVDEVRRKTAAGYGDPVVVVAIGYPEDDPWNKRRSKDLTPWPADTRQYLDSYPVETMKHGGANAFLETIKTRIIPAVEKDYNVDPNRRTLAGHSYGGLFTLYVFFTEPELFQNYAAASPSLWYGGNKMFDVLEEYKSKHRKSPIKSHLLILVGGCEETPGGCDPALSESPEAAEWTVNVGRMVSNATALYKGLHKLLGDAVTYRIIEGENHSSVIGSVINWTTAFAMTTSGIKEKKEKAQKPAD